MRELLFGKAEGKARRRLQFVLLALVLALAAAAAGCGGDDGRRWRRQHLGLAT